LSNDDIFLGDSSSSIGNNDPYDNESNELIIPASTEEGIYYILFHADDDNEITESDENNNTACIQITIENTATIEDFTNNKLVTIHPNPTDNYINYVINKPSTVISHIIVLNEPGQVIKRIDKPKGTINLTDITNGSYIIIFYNSNEIISKYRVIKK
jgi:hypothetical protein